MNDIYNRTERLIGADALDKLKKARVAVFGLGGVGSFIAEALARAGVGALDLFDNDVVTYSNINRQLVAYHSTVSMPKVDVMKTRILDINPECEVVSNRVFYSADNAQAYDFTQYSYIADAIDTVSSKLLLIEQANKCSTPIISSMGTGNKLDPSRFKITDINKTSVCPLARVMRRELRARGIERLKVIFSDETPLVPAPDNEVGGKQNSPASISFVPSCAGLMLAGEIIRDIAGLKL